MLHSAEPPFRGNSHWETGREDDEKAIHRATPVNSEEHTTQNSIAALPVVTYQAGESVIVDGSRTGASYVLGGTSREHERLSRQARIFNPFTERLFRNAGISRGQRVLDIGSGVGDVAMLVAQLVGPTGEVVGVERDANTLTKARSRVAEAQLRNVSFVEADIGQIASSKLRSKPFDAVVGRLILEYVSDPAAVLRSLSNLVLSGGVIVFQDCYWAPLLQLTARLPLWARCASLIYRAFERSGANINMEHLLYRAFLDAGLPTPKMVIEIPMDDSPDLRRWVYDIFCTLYPQMHEQDLSTSEVGDLESLLSRLDAELDRTKSFAGCIGLIGAWSQMT
jgi:tRNA A58 N-methylase Trm61